jgi:hypothetical protein
MPFAALTLLASALIDLDVRTLKRRDIDAN